MTEQTKQITFEGREYTVPVWVKWVAVNSDGHLCGYETKPTLHVTCFYTKKGRWCSIGGNWRDSLTEV